VNRRNILVLTGLILVIGSIGAVVGFGQAKLAYVKSQSVLDTYPPYQDAQKKLEAEDGQWRQEIQKMSEQLKQLQDQLEQQSLLLSEAKKKEKAQELQNLAMKAQQYQQEKWGQDGEFFKRQSELLKPIFDQVNVIINKIGQEGSYDFIFDITTANSNILYAPTKYDLTDQVIARLAKEYPAASTKPTTPGGK
jgi:outer membrane protein